MKRGELIRSPRENLLRLARYLGLRIGPEWSNKHIASLIYWRCTRHVAARRRIERSLY